MIRNFYILLQHDPIYRLVEDLHTRKNTEITEYILLLYMEQERKVPISSMWPLECYEYHALYL